MARPPLLSQEGNTLSKHFNRRHYNVAMNRRTFLAAAVGATVAPQQPQISSTPSQRDFSHQDPIQYPDPNIIALDDRFRRYIVNNTVIRRLHFGTLWAEIGRAHV